MGTFPADDILTVESGGLWSIGVIGGALLVGGLVHVLLFWLAERVNQQASGYSPLPGTILRRIRGPLWVLIPLLFVYLVLPTVRTGLSFTAVAGLTTVFYVAFVTGGAWLLIEALRAGEETVGDHYTTDEPDNLKARKIVTQVRILRRIATSVIVVLAVGVVLLQYEPFREIGTGILASAGIVGIVVGVAAQNTLADLIAGIQIALTQPIRVDDVVIVEGDFGWVEEITLTYVVVRVWDRRRIVLPITHFVDKPFQNWTRTSSDLIGSVFLKVDYRTPVGAVREELRRIVEGSEYWDGDVCALHVTDAGQQSIELRAIASAADAPQLWELRCEVRESLIAYLRDEHPGALPVVRARLEANEEIPDTAPSEREEPE